MDVSQVTFQPASPGTAIASSATVAGSAGGGIAGSAQVVPAASSSAPQNTDTAKQATSTQAQIAQAVNQVNDTFAQRDQNLYATFGKDQTTGISVVKIVDKNTKEVISQIPSKEIIGFAQFLDQSQGKGGQFLNVKA